MHSLFWVTELQSYVLALQGCAGVLQGLNGSEIQWPSVAQSQPSDGGSQQIQFSGSFNSLEKLPSVLFLPIRLGECPGAANRITIKRTGL